MTAMAVPISGYAQAAKALGTPRSIEHKVFSTITGRMSRASQAPADFPALVAAVHDNLSLWTAITADVADSRNALPAQLRAQLVYLGAFTRAHTQKVLRGEAEAAPLIEINTTVMRGLRGQTAP
ncbi:MAG: flagellar biosynthesis regulator FlaF [Thermohalobaculum sp.]|nr:flagellar biosynthesis regulator FlaF [Thermohalobaculum sp.]